MKTPHWKLLASTTVLVLSLLSPLVLLGQNGTPAKSWTLDQFAGNYKGSAKDPAGAMILTLEIKSENGKLSGRLIAPKKEQSITSGEVADGKLTLKLAAGDGVATLVLHPQDNKLVGDWKIDKQIRVVEFEKIAVTAPVVVEVKQAPEASTAELLTGVWDAAADNQGQSFPFTLTLKVEGEKVTGGSSSQLGDSTISSGVWKDGKLAVMLEGGSGGQVALIATIVDGKLVGDYDFAGQLRGKWVATKKP